MGYRLGRAINALRRMKVPSWGPGTLPGSHALRTTSRDADRQPHRTSCARRPCGRARCVRVRLGTSRLSRIRGTLFDGRLPRSAAEVLTLSCSSQEHSWAPRNKGLRDPRAVQSPPGLAPRDGARHPSFGTRAAAEVSPNVVRSGGVRGDRESPASQVAAAEQALADSSEKNAQRPRPRSEDVSVPPISTRWFNLRNENSISNNLSQASPDDLIPPILRGFTTRNNPSRKNKTVAVAAASAPHPVVETSFS
jgi:hypothetical protein